LRCTSKVLVDIRRSPHGLRERLEQLLVEALVAELAVEALV
jgi:hypothetical protein